MATLMIFHEVDDVEQTLHGLSAEYTEQGRGFELRTVAGGWRFYSHPAAAPVAKKAARIVVPRTEYIRSS